MKQQKAILALVLTLALLAGCAAPAAGLPSEAPEQPAVSGTPAPTEASASAAPAASQAPENTLEDLYYDREVYESAKEAAEPYAVSGEVLGGIVPHHGTASKMIASFYGALTESYDTVIIIGPNHYTKLGGVVYSDCDWQTAYGDLKCDGDLAALLNTDQDVKAICSGETVQNDHSVGWQLPFVADYLGDAKVVGILLSGLASQKQLSALAALIGDYAADKKVLVIGSVDFSHYLMPEAAAAHDTVTEDVIARKDYGRLFTFDSDNMDSPETVFVVMKATEAMGGGGLTFLDRSVSYEQAGGTEEGIDPGEGTTTYLIYAAVKAADG